MSNTTTNANAAGATSPALVQIRITGDHAQLWRVGGREYADHHQAQTYMAEIKSDGWASVELGSAGRGAKFAPDTFTDITPTQEQINESHITNAAMKTAARRLQNELDNLTQNFNHAIERAAQLLYAARAAYQAARAVSPQDPHARARHEGNISRAAEILDVLERAEDKITSLEM